MTCTGGFTCVNQNKFDTIKSLGHVIFSVLNDTLDENGKKKLKVNTNIFIMMEFKTV